MRIIVVLFCFCMKIGASEFQLHFSKDQRAAYFRNPNNVAKFNEGIPLSMAEQKAYIEIVRVQIANYPDYQSFCDAMWQNFELTVTDHYEYFSEENERLLFSIQELKWKYGESAHKYFRLREYEAKLKSYLEDVDQLADKDREIIKAAIEVMKKEVIASPSYYGRRHGHDKEHIQAIEEITEEYKQKADALLQKK